MFPFMVNRLKDPQRRNMATIKLDEEYVVAQADRSKFVPIDRDYLTTLGYPLSGQGKCAVLTYDIGGGGGGGGGGVVSSSTSTPIAGSGQRIEITNVVITLSTEITVDPTAKIIRISFVGNGDINITYDGVDPSTTIGEVWFKGGILEVNPTIAGVLKLVRATASNSAIYVTQFA